MLISLGSNCHPAYWMKLLKVTEESFPFDWLLSKGQFGLDHVADVVENDFEGFLDNLQVNHRGHPIAPRYPLAELFHHHDLVSEDLAVRQAEIDKLTRRIERFKTQAEKENDFLYCYPIDAQTSTEGALAQFEASVVRILRLWPQSRLHVYFLEDVADQAPREWIASRDRLHQYAYFRDQTVSKTWGTAPIFLSRIRDFVTSEKGDDS